MLQEYCRCRHVREMPRYTAAKTKTALFSAGDASARHQTSSVPQKTAARRVSASIVRQTALRHAPRRSAYGAAHPCAPPSPSAPPMPRAASHDRALNFPVAPEQEMGTSRRSGGAARQRLPPAVPASRALTCSQKGRRGIQRCRRGKACLFMQEPAGRWRWQS